jgi:hypothetical protein
MSRPTNPVPPEFSGIWILYPEDLPQVDIVARGIFNVTDELSVEDHSDQYSGIDVTDEEGAVSRCGLSAAG